MNKIDWIQKFQLMDALWLFNHNGDPKKPHALLTSDLHSDGFFNGGIVVSCARFLDEAAGELADKFSTDSLHAPFTDDRYVNLVVGPAMGAITLSHVIASKLGRTQGNCLTSYTEKSGKEMIFTRIKPKNGDNILLVEDVITTGGSLIKTEQAVIKAGGKVLPFILALVNRSGKKEINGKKIYSLIDCKISTWNKEECPLCKAGSKAIRPKESDNWTKLVPLPI